MAATDNSINIFALGGLGEVGKNTYCFESSRSIILVDAGVRFPEANLPGVDYVIPDYSFLRNNRGKFKALFITHGHEDHIGGIPFLARTIHIPVIYAPRLAAALIRHKLEEHRIKDNIVIREVKEEPHAQRLGRDARREQDRSGAAGHLRSIHDDAMSRGQHHLGGREGREVVPSKLDGPGHQSRPLARP